jgi:hypothetical protein
MFIRALNGMFINFKRAKHGVFNMELTQEMIFFQCCDVAQVANNP